MLTNDQSHWILEKLFLGLKFKMIQLLFLIWKMNESQARCKVISFFATQKYLTDRTEMNWDEPLTKEFFLLFLWENVVDVESNVLSIGKVWKLISGFWQGISFGSWRNWTETWVNESSNPNYFRNFLLRFPNTEISILKFFLRNWN